MTNDISNDQADVGAIADTVDAVAAAGTKATISPGAEPVLWKT